MIMCNNIEFIKDTADYIFSVLDENLCLKSFSFFETGFPHLTNFKFLKLFFIYQITALNWNFTAHIYCRISLTIIIIPYGINSLFSINKSFTESVNYIIIKTQFFHFTFKGVINFHLITFFYHITLARKPHPSGWGGIANSLFD